MLTLTLACASLFPIMGDAACRPVLQFLDLNALIPSVVTTLGLGSLLIGAELIKSELTRPNLTEDSASRLKYIRSLVVAVLMVVLVLVAPGDSSTGSDRKTVFPKLKPR